MGIGTASATGVLVSEDVPAPPVLRFARPSERPYPHDQNAKRNPDKHAPQGRRSGHRDRERVDVRRPGQLICGITAMARHTNRPIIFPLSNPTERSEATPHDLLAWTEDRAVVGSGSPFPPIIRGSHPFRIDQVNNTYVFPGVGLGAIAIKARHISEGMFLAAARAIVDLSPAKRDQQANLLLPLAESRTISRHVAIAVAEQAAREGLAGRLAKDDLDTAVKSMIWEPIYSTYQRLPTAQRG
jgi:Malic enzyme, NAD binding domain